MFRTLRIASAALVLTAVFCSPASAGPGPVLLGTAAEFAVLGGSGLTNTGISTITGDIGSSPTHGETGFAACPAADCVNLTGTNHDVADPNDAVTQQAKTDLVTAYDDAFARTGGTAITAPLGGGTTLVSGVYTSAADIFVGGDLTLDGGGDPNSVFIFQAKTGTLITAAGISGGVPNTRVLLTNGAQACNVFWQVGSSATIATFTQFVGNVLALSSITVDTSATLDTSRVLARNGAVTLHANTITRSTCATPPAASPTPTPTATTTPSPIVVPPVTTPTPVPAATPTPGTAHISGPSAVVHGPFTITVTGHAIEEVIFYIDGHRVGSAQGKPGRTKFTLRFNPAAQRRRVHHVVARVRFKTSAKTRSVIRRFIYRRAVTITPRAPRFTG